MRSSRRTGIISKARPAGEESGEEKPVDHISIEQLAFFIEHDYQNGIISLEEFYRLRRIYGLPSLGERNCTVCGTANLPDAAACFRCGEPFLTIAAGPALTLKGITGPHAGQFLCFQGRVLMGRDRSCQLLFAETEAAISRRHAAVAVVLHRDRLAMDGDRTGARQLQHVDAAKEGGLARTRAADDGDDVALMRGQ